MKAERYLRVGTLNVRALAGKASNVLALAEDCRLDVLLLQETRLPRDSYVSFAQLAGKYGWHVHIHDQVVGTDGRHKWGAITMARWPVEALNASEVLPPGRGGLLRVWRPAQRPLLLFNLYLSASSRSEAGALLEDLLTFAAGTGEACIMAGDYNLTQTQWPVSAACALGRWRAADEMILGDAPPPPTHRLENGDYGRCLDYAIGTEGLIFAHRGQERGPADHDLVFYDVLLAGAPPCPAVFPRRRKLAEHGVDAQDWQRVWQEHSLAFHEALGAGDIDGAWCLLSDAAEMAIGCEPRGIKRSQAAIPRPLTATSTKAPTHQSIRERRLRRLVRRVREHLRGTGDEAEKRVRHGKILGTAREFGLLPTAALRGRPCLEFILQAAEQEAEVQATRTSTGRKARWMEQVQLDYAKAAKWVTRELPRQPTADMEADWTAPLATHEKLSAARRDWEAQWTQTDNSAQGDTRQFVATFLQARPPEPDDTVFVTAAEVKRRVEKSRRKATGMDGWSAQALLQLPDEFFVEVSTLWRAMLEWRTVPSTWKDIRVALLAKPEGGFRPLSIGAILWRALASVCCGRLREWTQTWASVELQGGLAARGTHGVHDPLLADLELSQSQAGELYGIKTDLKRCFDNVRPQQALAVCQHLGMPASLVALIADYYKEQRRFLVINGQADRRPIHVACGLQQGCPFSVLLVNAVAQVWVAAVTQQVEQVVIRIFLDDRTVWTKLRGQAAVDRLLTVVAAGAPVDDHFGMQVHPGKKVSFASTNAGRHCLGAHAEQLGAAATTFKLLGVVYSMEKGRVIPHVEALTDKIKLRCERIAGLAKSLQMRRVLLRTTVISLIAWAGPWQKYAQVSLKTWISLADRALWQGHRPRARSRFLGFAVIGGADASVDFNLAFEVVRHEWHRAEAAALGHTVPSQPGSRWSEVCKRWGWSYSDGQLTTLFGLFVPGLHTLRAVKLVAKQAWQQELWDTDARTDGSGPLGRRVPVLSGLRKFAENASRNAMRVAAACPHDGIALDRAGVPNFCECGSENPSARHLAFDCPLRPNELPRGTQFEERLLVKLLTLPLQSSEESFAWEPELLAAMDKATASNTTILAATDGGCLVKAGLELFQRAAWAVVVRSGGTTTTVSGLVQGGEQTPAAAERTAIQFLLRHVRRAQCHVTLFVDNQAAVRRLHRAWLQGFWQGPLERFWREAAEGLHEAVSVAWIPSHGKKAQWTAPAGVETWEARELNDLADRACAAQLAALMPGWSETVDEFSRATAWSFEAAQNTLAVTEDYSTCVGAVYGSALFQEPS